MSKNKAFTLESELIILRRAALGAYTRLLPDTIDPAVDPLYDVPNTPIRWEANFGESIGGRPRLLVRPDRQTNIRIQKDWWGHSYTNWSLTFRGQPPTQFQNNVGEVMSAAAGPKGLEYHFWPGGNGRPGDWFSQNETLDPADRERDPRLILVDYLSAAVLDAARVAPPLQRTFTQEFQRLTGYEAPKNYGGRFAGRPNDLLREIESMGAVAASPTTAVYIKA